MSIKVIGIDIGKSNFHLVGHDSSGKQLLKKKLTRAKLIEFLANLTPTTSQQRNSQMRRTIEEWRGTHEGIFIRSSKRIKS